MDRSKWEYKPFEDCIEKSKKTKQLMTSDYQPEGAYPIISQEASLISGYTDDSDYVNHFERPVVIFGDHTRVLKYVDFDFAVGADGVKILIPHTNLDAKFLLSFLTWYKIPNLGYSRHYKLLKEISVPVPPISDQQRIVAELDCLNEMIAVKQEQLKEFDKLAQSFFYDMFGDDGGFEKVKLGDVVEVVSGLVDPNIEPYCSQLHVSPANIISGTNEIVNCIKAKDEGLISDKYPFKAGMVLYSKIRPNLNKVAVANFDGICSADMYPLTVLAKANNVFITKLLSSKQFLEYAIKNSGRARMPKLNRETLFSYSFRLPPLSLQQQFADKISAIEAQKELVKQCIAETQALLDYTMDKYFG